MIKDSQIIELFTYISELKDGEPLNKSQLSKQTGISRKSITRFCDKLAFEGYSPKDVLSFTPDKLNTVIRALGHRKDFKQPDFKVIYNFMHPARVYKNKPTLEQAWLELYVKDNFNVQTESLHKNCLKFEGLPELCMSLNTFKRAYKAYVTKHMSEYSGLSDTASLGEVNPGALMEIDGNGDILNWQDQEGVKHRACVFTASLRYSGMLFIYACEKKRTIDWAEFIIAALDYFGGAPACIKSDNDVALSYRKKIFNSGGKSFIRNTPNSTMQYLARCYQTDWLLAGPVKPRHKGQIEAFVNVSERLIRNATRIINGTFSSLEDLNKYLKELSFTFNNQYVAGSSWSHQSFFDMYEKQHLQPLPPEAKRPKLYEVIECIVSQRGYVRFKGNDYFVGKEYCGLQVTCFQTSADRFSIRLFNAVGELTSYKIDNSPSIRIKRIKHSKDYSPKEKAMTRTLDDYLKLSHEVTVIEKELSEFFTYVFHSCTSFNDVDRVTVCNRIFNDVKRNLPAYEKYKQAFRMIIDTHISKYLQMTQIIDGLINIQSSSKTRQFTPKRELLEDIKNKVADTGSVLESTSLGADYFIQVLNDMESVNDDTVNAKDEVK